MKTECFCDEGFLDNADGTKRRTGLNAHDCAYVAARNALIPEAEVLAADGGVLTFMRAMDELARRRIYNG